MNTKNRIFAFLTLAALILMPAHAAKKKNVVVEKDPAGAGISIGVLTGSPDIEKLFQSLQEAKFTSCQLGYASYMNQAYADRLKAAQQKYGIRVTTVVICPGNYAWDFIKGPSTNGLVPVEGIEAKMDAYRQAIDFCQMARIPAMHSHFGFIPEDPLSPDYRFFINNMRELAVYAKERGVDIYFETGQETPIALVRTIKDVGTGNLFINCDVANLILYGKANPTDAVRLFGPLVKDLHIKDGTYPDREDPYHLGHEKPIPEGDVDFPAIIKILKEEGYQGALTIEYELGDQTKDYMEKTRLYLQNLLDTKY